MEPHVLEPNTPLNPEQPNLKPWNGFYNHRQFDRDVEIHGSYGLLVLPGAQISGRLYAAPHSEAEVVTLAGALVHNDADLRLP